MRTIKFRAWNEEQKYMAYQGTPDLETLQSFIFHFGDKELMQFTGLHDKNGKKIYEGDIVTDGVGKYKIIYDLKLAGYQPYCIFRDDPENYCEVIGNVFENPELLENNLAD